MLGDIIANLIGDLVGDAVVYTLKKHKRRFALCAALAAPLLVPNSPIGHAQHQPAPQAAAPVTAAVVASRVQTFYDQTRAVEVRFEQHFWNRVYARTQSSRGQLLIQRPGRVRFNYDQPRGKVVVSTPAGFVFYEPNEDGTPGQFLRGSSADGASSALGFLSGTSRLDRDFRFSLRPNVAGQPADTDALELRPRRSDPHYRRIILYVDNRAASVGVVRRVAIEDPDGNWNRFDFSDPHFNRDLSASTFEYAPPAGAHEISAPGTPTVGPATPAR